MEKFIKTEKRSNILFQWLIEDYKELKEVEKDKINYLDDDRMLFILNSRINLIRDDIAFCMRNIVEWHLSQKDRNSLNNLFPPKIDNSINYMM